MRNDGGKWIFFFSLTAVFALLTYLCVDGRIIDQWTAEMDYPRQNETLYLQSQDEGVLCIGGEGKLYGADMQAMLEAGGWKKDDVSDIIIGNGITEIGYQAISSIPHLRTVRIGDDVRVTGNGSLRVCEELQFVYLPSGLERAGRDFLYDCNRCYVVTNGSCKELPKLKNTKTENIIEFVDSYETMMEAWAGGTELPEILEDWWQ